MRPALALTAADEVETNRHVLLEAATRTTRETWATCTCPECGKELELVVAVGYASEIRNVLDHGDDALRWKLESWEPETRATLARVLGEVA